MAILCATPVQAQVRPLATEPALTNPAGSVRIEAGGDLLGSLPNPLTARARTVVTGPILRVVVSAADNVELDVGWPAIIAAYQDPDFGDESDWGDVWVRSKIRFLQGGGRRPTLAFRVGFTLPETRLTRGLGPNALRTRAEILATGELSGTRWHINAGGTIQDDAFRPHAQRDYFTYGVAAEHRVGKRATMVAEVAGQTDGEIIDASRNEARLGVRVPTGKVVWDVAVRRGIGWASGRWGVTLGTSFAVWRPSCGRAPVRAE
jgi:hypothetical protein